MLVLIICQASRLPDRAVSYHGLCVCVCECKCVSVQEVGNRQTMLITMGNACWAVVAAAAAVDAAVAIDAAAAAREMQLITYADGSHWIGWACRNPAN